MLHTRADVTRAVLERAAMLTSGLNARLRLIAVHHSADHASLVEELIDLCAGCLLPSTSQVVLAQSRDDGFRLAIAPESTVLLGMLKPWPEAEKALAMALAEDGHNAVLIHVE